jgi:pyruvate,water dikinase
MPEVLYGLYGLQLRDEEMERYTAWVCDMAHTYPPQSPLMAYLRDSGATDAFGYGAEILSCPETKGLEWRLIDGMGYVTVREPRPEEVPEREKVFRERITPYIENWDDIWGKQIAEWTARVKPLQEFDLEHANNGELLKYFYEFLSFWYEMWLKHGEWMTAAYILFGLFRTTLQELTGITPMDPLFKKVLGGFDNVMVKFNRELWGLGDRAKELGVGGIFLTTEDDEEVLPELEESEAGRKWLEEYRAWLKVRGWRCNRAEEFIDNPSWIEKPSLGVPLIRQAIAKGGAFTVDAEFERSVKEREEAEKGIMAKIPADKREWVEKLMRCGQKAGVFSEDHNYYFDCWAMSIGRHLFQEYGKRFVKAGVIDRVDDIYMLMPLEIRKASIALERVNLRPYAQARREEWEKVVKLASWEFKPFLGKVEMLGEMVRKDPLMAVNAELPVVRPELKADLYGAASAPGVAEGVARIISDEAHFGELKPGEILICAATMPNWTPLFNIAAGVVTDGGGNLSHAVIVGREYGLPVVAGTLEATKKIKTGTKIRVDGNNGAVYILG